MIWADRFGFAWFCIVAAITALITLNPHFMLPMSEPVLWFDAIVIGVPWGFLRLLDFAFGGPQRRRHMSYR